MDAEQQTTPEAQPSEAKEAPEDAVAVSVEAVLLTADRAVSGASLASALGLGDSGVAVVEETIRRLNCAYEQTGRAFRIERMAGGWRAVTVEEAAPALAAFHGGRASARLSRAALETLAIVAYRQPIARAQIEAIRGVACGEVLRALLERDLIAVVGRAEEVGRPLLYGTTKRFLEVFGVSSVKDLPRVQTVDEAAARSRLEQRDRDTAGRDGATLETGDAAGDGRDHDEETLEASA